MRLPLVTLVTMLACDEGREVAETRRVTLPQTSTLPQMALTVPTLMTRPLDLASPEHPNAGYVLAGSDWGGADGFAARIDIARDDGAQPMCHGEWTTERRNGLEVKSCAAADLKAVLLPHPGGEIHCWSQWHAFGDLSPRQRAIADAIDASCTTITFE